MDIGKAEGKRSMRDRMNTDVVVKEDEEDEDAEEDNKKKRVMTYGGRKGSGGGSINNWMLCYAIVCFLSGWF